MNNLYGFIKEHGTRVEEHDRNSKNLYIELMKKSIEAYDFDDLEQKSNFLINDHQNIFEGYSRIGTARLLNVLAVLLTEGHKKELLEFWSRIMKIVLNDVNSNIFKSGVEFLVLELCTALYIGKELVNGDVYNGFIKLLTEIDPYVQYDSTLKRKPREELYNFCMYGICAEYLRGMLTGIDTDDFICEHWVIQKERFSGQGMYRDPGCPMVYDITSRYRLALMLNMGYEGKAAAEMKEVLERSAPGILFQISSNYKFPYGGRSNQFNFNEALIASMCEYYAAENIYRGEKEIAGVFKHCAYESIKRLDRWMEDIPPRHIKNFFPHDSGYGIDSYGTYERYMGTMGAFIIGAWIFCEDNIDEYISPNEAGGYVYETESDFHKIFVSCRGYSLEIDTNADFKYDANGLGRVHYKNAPCELALSMPFSPHPKYLLGQYANDKGRSICASWMHKGSREYLAEATCTTSLSVISEKIDKVEFAVEYSVENRGNLIEEYVVDADGVHIKSRCDFSDISYCIPVFISNGRDKSKTDYQKGKCSVELDGWEYTVDWDKNIEAGFEEYLLYNRNGMYKELYIENNKKQFEFKICIKRGVK